MQATTIAEETLRLLLEKWGPSGCLLFVLYGEKTCGLDSRIKGRKKNKVRLSFLGFSLKENIYRYIL